MQRPYEYAKLADQVRIGDEADLCVIGGSCTGVFAAVRAARLGLRVALVEKQNHFGGVAPITCTWHSLLDTVHRKQIIAGLTQEVLERLRQRDAVRFTSGSAHKGAEFRPGDLKIVLDDLVVEHGIRPYLHTVFVMPVVQRGRLIGVALHNKSGRFAIMARAFVDASGDGDLCAGMCVEDYSYGQMLPPTTCAFIAGWPAGGLKISDLIQEHAAEFGLPPGFVWGTLLPGTDVYMLAGTRVPHVDCSDGAQLTQAEIEGRRQVKGIMDLLRKYRPDLKTALHDFPASIGIRDTRHIRCAHQLTGDEVLRGTRFDDAIANGSYRVDIHHQDKPGITLMYLDGKRQYERPGAASVWDRWRDPVAEDPTFYQVPLRSLIPPEHGNLILAGRMLDADVRAFGAVRVMVNCNQMGEAAGVAAALSLSSGTPIPKLQAAAVRGALAKGGSVVL